MWLFDLSGAELCGHTKNPFAKKEEGKLTWSCTQGSCSSSTNYPAFDIQHPQEKAVLFVGVPAGSLGLIPSPAQDSSGRFCSSIPVSDHEVQLGTSVPDPVKASVLGSEHKPLQVKSEKNRI